MKPKKLETIIIDDKITEEEKIPFCLAKISFFVLVKNRSIRAIAFI